MKPFLDNTKTYRVSFFASVLSYFLEIIDNSDAERNFCAIFFLNIQDVNCRSNRGIRHLQENTLFWDRCNLYSLSTEKCSHKIALYYG